MIRPTWARSTGNVTERADSSARANKRLEYAFPAENAASAVVQSEVENMF